MKIGYCPTMNPFVKKLEKYETINLGSAGAVLMALNDNEIDVGIVGRVAKNGEFDGHSKRTADGYTLVTTQKQMILNEDLPMLEVHTALPKDLVSSKFPELKNVVFEDKLKQELKNGEVWLISWDDWNDNYNLLIPVDQNYNKNPKFRVPHIFSKKKELVEEVFKEFSP